MQIVNAYEDFSYYERELKDAIDEIKVTEDIGKESKKIKNKNDDYIITKYLVSEDLSDFNTKSLFLKKSQFKELENKIIESSLKIKNKQVKDEEKEFEVYIINFFLKENIYRKVIIFIDNKKLTKMLYHSR